MANRCFFEEGGLGYLQSCELVGKVAVSIVCSCGIITSNMGMMFGKV